MSEVTNQSNVEFKDNFDFNIIFEISDNKHKHAKEGGKGKSRHAVEKKAMEVEEKLAEYGGDSSSATRYELFSPILFHKF